jgi:hypothetical protein
MPAGRPSEYNFELCAEICEHVADGLSIRKALKQSDKYPSWATFRKWKFENAELLNKYDIAKQSMVYKTETRCNSNPKGSRATNKNDYRVRNAREQNKRKYPKSDIYIFKMGELGVYKIGVSQNIHRRLRDINAANHFTVLLMFSLSVMNAYDLEDKIHKTYEFSALQNEWFALSENDVEDVIKTITQWQKQPVGTGLQYSLAI